MRSDVMMAGSSDGGAHVLSFCGADFTTRLLTEWVPEVLGLEAAVARLTSIPAAACGIHGRGVLAEGAPADVNVIDPERLAAGDTPRYVHDFPAGSGRYVVDADGYVATIVNGEVLLADGDVDGNHTRSDPARRPRRRRGVIVRSLARRRPRRASTIRPACGPVVRARRGARRS